MSTEGPGDPAFLDRVQPVFERIARVHDYRCVGLEHLPDGPAMLVGYHGRPALDAFLLGFLLRKHTGAAPRAVTHRVLTRIPRVRRWVQGFGMVVGSRDELAAAAARGERLLVLPGGARECFRSSRVRYQLDWGERRGYARLALRLGLPIVPFATAGVDELYHVIGDGYRISKALTGTEALPLCLPLGHRRLPFGPPRPVPLHQHVGAAVEPYGQAEDPDAVAALDARVRARVQALLSEALARPLCSNQGWTL
ncbi:MAG: acyltransferase family protein [Alphaproteobacteria bacterium]|nr:acyltransferase family protein [Alphaproteobacteria bacterium]